MLFEASFSCHPLPLHPTPHHARYMPILAGMPNLCTHKAKNDHPKTPDKNRIPSLPTQANLSFVRSSRPPECMSQIIIKTPKKNIRKTPDPPQLVRINFFQQPRAEHKEIFHFFFFKSLCRCTGDPSSRMNSPKCFNRFMLSWPAGRIWSLGSKNP